MIALHGKQLFKKLLKNQKKRARALAIVPLTCVVAAISGSILLSCTPASLVEQGIERELPKYVGPADSYKVDIDGLKVNDGTASTVVALGERVHPKGAPVIEQLKLELEGVVYDRDNERLSKIDGARLTAVIKTPDLVTFLEAYRDVR
ncbi:MAG: hypothetical protein AAGJ80_18615, partial [Cyanobacteria bacterium J06553_1]